MILKQNTAAAIPYDSIHGSRPPCPALKPDESYNSQTITANLEQRGSEALKAAHAYFNGKGSTGDSSSFDFLHHDDTLTKGGAGKLLPDRLKKYVAALGNDSEAKAIWGDREVADKHKVVRGNDSRTVLKQDKQHDTSSTADTIPNLPAQHKAVVLAHLQKHMAEMPDQTEEKFYTAFAAAVEQKLTEKQNTAYVEKKAKEDRQRETRRRLFAWCESDDDTPSGTLTYADLEKSHKQLAAKDRVARKRFQAAKRMTDELLAELRGE